MKKLFISILTAVFALFALGTSTFAWFSMNTAVEAKGMKVKATSASSLVITDTAANINTTATNIVTFSLAARELSPATHSEDAPSTKLQYVLNTGDVDAVTGYEQENKTFTMENVPASTESIYYVDYIVYIASKGDEIENQDLKATLTPDVSQTIFNAVSIDYWVNGSYVATEHFNDAADAEVLLTDQTIPSAAAGQYITVVMRIYLDGALESTTPDVAYVNNGTINTAEIPFSVAFSTVDHE